MAQEETLPDTSIILAQHSAELRALSDGFRETNIKLDRVFAELHGLAQNITVLSSQPSFSVSDVLDNIIKIATLCGFMVAGILYVNQAFLSSDLEKLRAFDEKTNERLDANRERISRLEGILILKGAGISAVPTAEPGKVPTP